MSTVPGKDPASVSSTSKKTKKKKSKAKNPARGPSNHDGVNGKTDPPATELEIAEDEEEGADNEDTIENDDEDVDAPSVTENATDSKTHVIPTVASNGVTSDDDDRAKRLELAAKERDDLRKQVTELRKELESIAKRHQDETTSIQSELDKTRSGKEIAESKYQKLLGQVNTIKTQLGERLKSDAAELAQAREHIDLLESKTKTADEDKASLESEISQLKAQSQQQADEISSLRGRTNLSQQNWAKERDDLIRREAQAREELEDARQTNQDYDILIMDERAAKEGLIDRVAELEDRLSNEGESHEKAASELEKQSETVDALQRALQEIHEARKQERRELVESTQKQLDDLRSALKTAEESSSESSKELETVKADLERVLPFEKEVKEKNLLIGKLRHEAVILNDHLTKALRFLKKGKPEDNVDRQLVTNHLLRFLALDRSDPKKFQVLQLISSLLGWTEEQNETAGLARPGASSSLNIKVPLSGPFRRVSSTATLNPMTPGLASPSFPSTVDTASGRGSESLAELWSDFLEREAQDGSSASGRRGSRPSSTASTPRVSAAPGYFSPPLVGSPRPPSKS